ncbi:MAG TPA: ABC transporter permease [Vicinamibacterales bacterium]|nr:ABC transporter permease [Vicinamibacterales bacterium]
MSFAWFVARRYLTARRRQAFISLISAVSIVGIGVGVMALIIALALMTGVQSELRDRIVGSTAHIYVYKHDGYKDIAAELKQMQVDGVTGAAPAISGQGMMSSNGSLADGVYVQLKGIDPALEPAVTDIRGAIKTGSLDALTTRPEFARDGVILGADLAHELAVTEGDLVSLITPRMVVTPSGPVPMSLVLRVVGTARFGFYATDTAAAFVTLDTAARALGRPGPDLIQLRLADLGQARSKHQELQARLGDGYDIDDWTELNGPLYSALELEKLAISLTIGLIVMVAALNIVASLVLLVMEKSRDIAILRTMGATARAIRMVFILQGLTIGMIGTLGGTVLGLVVCFVADRYHLIQLPADVYQIAYLPFRVQPLDVVIVFVSVLLVCLAATIYPSRQAGRLDPAEALRNQ